MAVHIDEMTSDINVVEGELPLSAAQIDKLVTLVLHRLEEHTRDAHQRREASAMRGSVAPALHGD